MQRIDGERKVLGGLLILVPSKYKSIKHFKEVYIANNQCPNSCIIDSTGIKSKEIIKEIPINKSSCNFKLVSADTKLKILFKVHHSIIPIIITTIISFVASISILDVFMQTTLEIYYNISLLLYITSTILASLVCIEIYLFSWWNEEYNTISNNQSK